MNVDNLIKIEMTPKTVTHWGQEHHNHVPVLIDAVHGDGQCLIYIVPLATRPDYYILRVDSSVREMIKEDDDEIRDYVEELYGTIASEWGRYEEENDDGEEVPFPALNITCGSGWGEII